MTPKALLCDVSNGSYISLALANPGQGPDVIGRYACSGLDEFTDSVMQFLADNGRPALVGGAFSTSGWEVDGIVDLVHYGFALTRDHLRAVLGLNRIHLVNEFVAKALAIPTLDAEDRIEVSNGTALPEQVMVILGPTVGFGGALLAPDGMGRWTASHCEGGHSDFAPANLLEIDILKLLMAKYGHVSRERAVSLPGLVELWQCLAQLEGRSVDEVSADEIVARAYCDDRSCQRAITLQTEIFAGTAADYALITGARGGVYLSGSLIEVLGDLFDHEIFSRRFHQKGRVSSYVRDIPVYKVIAKDTEVIGLSTLFSLSE